jgi:DNA-binding CsgD family transcriptional regulator
LTARERQVLQLLAESRNSKQIAAVLGISVRTADANRQQLMEKLRLGSIADLTRYAIRMGISPL